MGKKKKRAIQNSRVPHGTPSSSSQRKGCNSNREDHDCGNMEEMAPSITSPSKDEELVDSSAQRKPHEVEPRSMNVDLEAAQKRAGESSVGSLSAMDQEKNARQWSQLLPDLIQVIFDRCTMLEYIRASSVCRSWASVASQKLHPPAPQLPWLMISESCSSDDYEEYDDEHISDLCDFFSPIDGQFHCIPVHCLLKRRCCGSSQGWLITADDNFNVALSNPFSGSQIPLPSQLRCPTTDVYVSGLKQRHTSTFLRFRDWRHQEDSRRTRFFIRKAILSSDPSSNRDCIVAAITTFDCLIYCRPGDERWSLLDGHYETFEDITFFMGKLCAVNNLENVVSCSFKPDPCLENMNVAPLRRVSEGRFHRYLVESCGSLLLVLRYFSEEETTTSFEVYKLEVEGGGGNWVEVTNLGDQMLFLGMNHSEAYSLRELSGSEFRGNCIYFTGLSVLWEGNKWVEFEGPFAMHDVREFCLEDCSISTFCSFESEKSVRSPIWVKPNHWLKTNYGSMPSCFTCLEEELGRIKSLKLS